MGVIEFKLQLGADGKRFSSMAMNDIKQEGIFQMQLLCEWCGTPTRSFEIRSLVHLIFKCEGCDRVGAVEVLDMAEGFTLHCKGKQEIARMVCYQFVPREDFLNVEGRFTVTDSSGVEHEMIRYPTQEAKQEFKFRGTTVPNVDLSHEFVRIKK